MKKIIFLLACFIFFTSCDNFTKSQPKKVFAVIGLNSNTVNGNFKRLFKEAQEQAKAGHLYIYEEGKTKTTNSFQVYFKSRYSNFFDSYIEKVNALNVEKEDQKMVDNALKMFNRADKIYSEDFLPIAKMMDEGRPNEEIDAAITQLTETKGAELEGLRENVLEYAISYAEKHNIEVKIF